VNLGLVTTVYNGYGRFLPKWCEAVAALDTAPDLVTVALGPGHDADVDHARSILPDLTVATGRVALMGPMRNVAVAATGTDWVMYLGVDDVILPRAVDLIGEASVDSDFVSVTWQSIMTWDRTAVPATHHAKTPQELVANRGRGFIVGHSPYRRWIWEQSPYKGHDYPNAPFLAGAVEAGARFTKTTEPVTLYLRRLDSHVARLGRRQQPAVLAERRKAIRLKKDAERRIVAHYTTISSV